MAYFPAHCDHQCSGCKRNHEGWCDWLDRATSDYDKFDHSAFTSTTSLDPYTSSSTISDNEYFLL